MTPPVVLVAEVLVRFSIAPDASGGWLWRTYDAQGLARAQGVAATRKIAAALVIHDIIQARTACAELPAPAPSARAA